MNLNSTVSRKYRKGWHNQVNIEKSSSYSKDLKARVKDKDKDKDKDKKGVNKIDKNNKGVSSGYVILESGMKQALGKSIHSGLTQNDLKPNKFCEGYIYLKILKCITQTSGP